MTASDIEQVLALLARRYDQVATGILSKDWLHDPTVAEEHAFRQIQRAQTYRETAERVRRTNPAWVLTGDPLS